uniref:Uncharacterized protein n=1 Tax=Mycena chlorophos TaxID=658473 RepID=A0ABQ0LM76_MYCCL|nr:predicted protein [Mycena chlorophos]
MLHNIQISSFPVIFALPSNLHSVVLRGGICGDCNYILFVVNRFSHRNTMWFHALHASSHNGVVLLRETKDHGKLGVCHRTPRLIDITANGACVWKQGPPSYLPELKEEAHIFARRTLGARLDALIRHRLCLHLRAPSQSRWSTVEDSGFSCRVVPMPDASLSGRSCRGQCGRAWICRMMPNRKPSSLSSNAVLPSNKIQGASLIIR